MSTITFSGRNNTLKPSLDKVIELKKNFLNLYRASTSEVKISENKDLRDIIQQMRVVHGETIYRNAIETREINGTAQLTDNDKITLSCNASIIFCIQCEIKDCEILLFKNNNERPSISNDAGPTSNYAGPQESNYARTQESNYARTQASNYVGPSSVAKNIGSKYTSRTSNIVAEINPSNTGTGTDIITLRNLTTDTDNGNPESRGTNNSFFLKGGRDMNTEAIDNLETTELGHIYSEYEREQTGGIHKNATQPTIILYWADWCGPSENFAPKWEEFKKQAPIRFPNLQVNELNIGKDDELRELARTIGVEGFPSLVLFVNGKTYKIVPTKLSVEDISGFIDKYL